MIIVLGKELSLTLRVKQVLCSQQLKDLRTKKINQNRAKVKRQGYAYHAGHTPDIDSRVPITTTKNSLWRAILTSLYIFREVLLGRSGISKISDFDGNWRWQGFIVGCQLRKRPGMG